MEAIAPSSMTGDLVSGFFKVIGATLGVTRYGYDFFSVPGARLRGVQEILFRNVTSGLATVSTTVQELLEVVRPGHFSVVFAPQMDPLTLPQHDRLAVFLPSTIEEILKAPNPLQAFCDELVRQLKRQFLSPFSVTRPTSDNMFFGRNNEIRRLYQEVDNSFAIPGPGRIGKTSLITYYRSQLHSRRDARSKSTYLIDFLDCPSTSPDVIANFIAMRIGKSSKAYKTDVVSFPKYLRREYVTEGQRIEIICDEVDHVCTTIPFLQLGEAARQGFVRLVLCGRFELFKLMNYYDAPLRSRLLMINLTPLDIETSTSLLLEPMKHLGIPVLDPASIAQALYAQTGGYPHLVQRLGEKLVEAFENGLLSSISYKSLQSALRDNEISYLLSSPLLTLTDPFHKLIAATTLLSSKSGITIDRIQATLSQSGVVLSLRQVSELCDLLVIQNVLTRRGDCYAAVNDAIVSTSGGSDYLLRLKEEALEEIL